MSSSSSTNATSRPRRDKPHSGDGMTEERGNEVLRTRCGGCTLQGEEPAYL
jgi:hypothetical protein